MQTRLSFNTSTAVLKTRSISVDVGFIATKPETNDFIVDVYSNSVSKCAIACEKELSFGFFLAIH